MSDFLDRMMKGMGQFQKEDYDESYQKNCVVSSCIICNAAMPIGVFAVSFKDALSEESRGISVLAHYVKEDAGRQVCFTSTNIIRRQL